MKKYIFLLMFLAIFFFVEMVFAETYCIESTYKFYDGQGVPTTRVISKCFDNKSSFETGLRQEIEKKTSVQTITSLIRIGDDNKITQYRHKEQKGSNGKEVFKSDDVYGFYFDAANKKENPYCFKKDKTAPVACFKDRDECLAEITSEKSPSLVFNSCQGDGIMKNRAGDIVKADGTIITPLNQVRDVPAGQTRPYSKYCFKSPDIKVGVSDNEKDIETCGRDLVECQELRSIRIGELTELADPEEGKTTEDYIGACEGKYNNDTPGANDTPGVNNPPESAPNTPPTSKVVLKNPLGNITNISQLITRLVNIALNLALAIASLAILWSGFLFVKAQGKEKEITDARNRLQWTVIGLAVILGANVIVRIIEATIKSLSTGV